MSAPSTTMEVSDEGVDQVPVKHTSSSDNSLGEYETQLLGFTPVTLINGMFNSVCDIYREALKAFSATCKEKYPDVMTDDELKQARHAVSQLIDKDVSEVFDKLEMFALRNIFSIPDECILPEDLCQLTYNPSATDSVGERTKEIKKKIIAVKYANALLVKELESAEAFKALLNKVLADLNDFKQDANKDVNVKDILTYFSDTIITAFNKTKSGI